MKKIIKHYPLLALFFAIFLTGCSLMNSGVLPGYTDSEEHFEEDGFQDYTDYCKYIYEPGAEEKFAGSSLYEIVGDSTTSVEGYFENCRTLMDSGDRMDEFDFDASCISENDYVYVINKNPGSPLKKYDNYDVYLYDVEGHTLYFIHNNN